MVDIPAISGILVSLKASKDILEAMVGLRGTATFQEKRLELQSKIMDAQGAIFAVNEERTALIERVSNLEKQVADFETWESEKQRYKLKQVDVGAFCYAVKNDAQPTEPPHWICAACYGNRKKSILQDNGPASTSGIDSRSRIYKCFECKAEIRVHYLINPTTPEEGPANAS